MVKRRKTSSGPRYQVPSLQSLALQAVRKRGSKTYSHSHSNLRQSLFGRMSDADMSESRSGTTSTSGGTAAQQGAKQVGNGLQVTVPRAIPHGYNNSYTVRLTYTDALNLTVLSAAGYALYTWRTNSIYDPDYTGTGHQPLMRDLWASQYDYYTVLACHYKIELYNCSGRDPITYTAVGTSAQSVNSVVATILPTTNVSDITAMGSGLPFPSVEMKNSQSKALWPESDISFSGTLTPGDFLVDAKDADTDATWTAVGANPAVPRYLGLALNSFNSGNFVGQNEASAANIQMWVKLDFDVQFTQLNQSLRVAAS